MSAPLFSAERLLPIVLLGGVAIGCAEVLRPFISAILWAAILVFSTWPMFQWLRRRLSRGVAAALMVLLEAVLLLLPLAAAVPGGAEDVQQLRGLIERMLQAGLPPAPAWVWQVPILGAKLGALWTHWAADLSGIGDAVQPYLGTLAHFALLLLLGIADGLLQIVLALLIAFFFYASGDRLALVLLALLRRVAGARADRLVSVTGATIRGVVYGLLGTALVQGLLTAFGLWMAGIARPVLLGVVAGSMSVLPIGAPAVWLPAAAWLLTHGHTLTAILLCVFGVVFISGSDNVIRPYFITRGAKLPFLLTVLGVLGGAVAYGLLGIFVGPVLLSVGFMLVREWAQPVPPVQPVQPVAARMGLPVA